MSVKIGQITNADVYLDDDSLVGRFKDFEVPAVEYKEITHETLGQVAVLSLPGRAVQALKGKVTIDFLDAALHPRLLNPTKFLSFSLHSYVDVFSAAGLDRQRSHRIVTNITVAFRKVGGKAFKLGDNFEGEAEYTATRLSQGLPGQIPILEIDVINQVYRISGEEVWPRY